MADDTRDSNQNNPAPASTEQPGSVDSTQPAKKFPKGVVLGKDGKPCRSCTSFASWAAQTNASLKSKKQLTPPSDCPPDVETLGRSSWTVLHSIAAAYPETPSTSQQSDLLGFVHLFAKLYPCWTCAEDFQTYIARTRPQVGSRSEFGLWLCDAHNDVNKKLGKPVFDCSLWEQRWRTGWKDGHCD
ncbi:hypothetical protein SAPIO_CDS4524 [Scedosporium apiospermum]|uniref:Sulfhydryl oxidase n=1 Tax=Pseudallescheria apiosperma TaxID=563466 RepID=A0A084G8D5_PSEDA|nr:uncharacterized protein SAPIO_CDS4524 [Scedosporium apiospermum]KEZ43597.1 hypothetical protein SAPIO_CDS4524 [Scedosporium apiospermum]